MHTNIILKDTNDMLHSPNHSYPLYPSTGMPDAPIQSVFTLDTSLLSIENHSFETMQDMFTDALNSFKLSFSGNCQEEAETYVSRYKKVANWTKPIWGTLSEEFRIVRRRHENP